MEELLQEQKGQNTTVKTPVFSRGLCKRSGNVSVLHKRYSPVFLGSLCTSSGNVAVCTKSYAQRLRCLCTTTTLFMQNDYLHYAQRLRTAFGANGEMPRDHNTLGRILATSARGTCITCIKLVFTCLGADAPHTLSNTPLSALFTRKPKRPTQHRTALAMNRVAAVSHSLYPSGRSGVRGSFSDMFTVPPVFSCTGVASTSGRPDTELIDV